jgi:hypothetical protein
MLRQFAGLLIVFAGGILIWRGVTGQLGPWTKGLGGAAIAIGAIGAVWPAVVRPIFTAWMIAAFPIGWTISKVTLGALFYLVFTPVSLVFRLMGRDTLALRRRGGASYWMPKAQSKSGEEYLRQF